MAQRSHPPGEPSAEALYSPRGRLILLVRMADSNALYESGAIMLAPEPPSVRKAKEQPAGGLSATVTSKDPYYMYPQDV